MAAAAVENCGIIYRQLELLSALQLPVNSSEALPYSSGADDSELNALC